MPGKLGCGLAGMLMSTALLAGTYDGVWILDPMNSYDPDSDFFVIYQNGNQLLFVDVWSDMDGWDAMLGTIAGNRAAMQTLMSADETNVTFSLEFSSPTSGFLTLQSCSGPDCDSTPPIGVPQGMIKVF